MLAFCVSTKDGRETYPFGPQVKDQDWPLSWGHNLYSEKLSREHQNIFPALELSLTWLDRGSAEGEDLLPVFMLIA